MVYLAFAFGEKIFCCLWTGKKTGQPYILFVEGNLLNHPHLESGDRKRMKIFRVDPGADLPKKVIESSLEEALELYGKYRNGVI
jgi:hypothetical protein